MNLFLGARLQARDMPTNPVFRFATFSLLVAITGCDRPPPDAHPAGSAAPAARPASKPPATSMLPPAELARTLGDPSAKKPIILFVGPQLLFAKHVPGARNAGESQDPEGLASLRAMAQPLARDAEIVIYCGCCPPRNCPNIRPAYAALVELGFTNVKVLDLPTTFRADWIAKGYPVETR